jgi:hypothetical protein
MVNFAGCTGVGVGVGVGAGAEVGETTIGLAATGWLHPADKISTADRATKFLTTVLLSRT